MNAFAKADLEVIQGKIREIMLAHDTRLVATVLVGCSSSAYAALIRAKLETPEKVAEIFAAAGNIAIEGGALPIVQPVAILQSESETRQ